MGYYNVIRPCVIGKLHYATIPAQPIELDDEAAAPLVEAGSLEPHGIEAHRNRGHVHAVVDASDAGRQAGESFIEGTIRTMPDVAEVAETMEPIEVELPARPAAKPRRARRPRES